MKSDIKVEFSNNDILLDLIKLSYFKDGQKGRLHGNKNYIEINQDNDDVMHTIVNGLHNATIKLTNSDIIDGCARFIISEDPKTTNIKLFPISMFCIMDENKKYSFY